ncbi:MAG: LysR family transcriptional regulator [Burkholderiales bacterium]|nr:LysR family transcriptional regulator [Burkholderiales bacterium]
MLDLRRLQHLVALADECHFARAAERVNLSQPAFSRSIQAIESQLGLRLFEREAGAVRPTPAGVFLVERARRLLFDARCVQRDVALYRDSRLGDTAFGAGPLPATTLLPAVLTALRRDFPEIGFRVEVNNWKLLLAHLQAEEIEFLVGDVREMPVDAALELRPLGRQHAGLYVRAGHRLAGREASLIEAWACGIASVRLPDAVKTGLAAALGLPLGAPAALALECDDVSLIKSVVLQGDSVLALTDAAVRAETESGVLRRLVLRDMPPLYAEMGLARLRNRTPSPAAQKVAALIETVAARVNAPRP